MNEQIRWFGDLDTPAPRTDGRTDWDDFCFHRARFLERETSPVVEPDREVGAHASSRHPVQQRS